MARAAPWRQTCPPLVRALQQLAQQKPLYLLRQGGPTAFTIQESDSKPVQVRLGDPHFCSCRQHQLTRELCLHICWVLLKKLQLKPHNALSYQVGLVPRELGDLLEPRRAVPHIHKAAKAREDATTASGAVPRRPVNPGDLCPICLLPFRDSPLPVVHCRYSCGNAVHTPCMVQVARHQLDSFDLSCDRLLSCPLCRGPFCRGRELAEATRRQPCRPKARPRPRGLSPVASHDVTCVFCLVRPVVGNLYRCLQCPQVLMCARCVGSRDFFEMHACHGYAIKKERWQTVREANWTKTISNTPKLLISNKIAKADVGKVLSDRKCAFCGREFEEAEVYAGKWRNFLLHMSCIDQWMADPHRPYSHRRGAGSRGGSSSGGLPMIDLSSLLGPPEVRVVRLSLSTRPQEPRTLPPDLPRPPPRAQRYVSPLRVRPRRSRKKKSQKSQTDVESERNKLPLSVTLGRALGAQVQPLMAILMSPRVRTSSLDSDLSNEDDQSDGEDKCSPKSKAPLLSITSLELPDLAPARNPNCQLVRRVRTSVRRSRPPAPAPAPNAQNIACAGLAMGVRK